MAKKLQQTACLKIRVFDLHGQRHQNKTLLKFYEVNELEKNKDSRTLNIEQGTFTSFVFSATGGMGREC